MLLQGRVSHRRRVLPPCALSPRHSLSHSLCVSRRQGLSLLPGEWAMFHCARSLFSVGLRPLSRCRAVSSVPRITVLLSREVYFLTVPSLSLARPVASCSFSCVAPARRRRRVMPCLHQHTRELCLLFSSCGSRFTLLHLDVVYWQTLTFHHGASLGVSFTTYHLKKKARVSSLRTTIQRSLAMTASRS